MRKKTTGYTLIEIIVVLLILSIFFLVGFVSYSDFIRRQAVSSAARDLRGNLRLAQTEALAGKKLAGCTEALAGYDFFVVSNQNPARYRVYVVCGPTLEVKEVNLEPGISLTSPSVNPIRFKPLSHGTNLDFGSSVSMVIASAKTSYTETVVVSSTGEVK